MRTAKRQFPISDDLSANGCDLMEIGDRGFGNADEKRRHQGFQLKKLIGRRIDRVPRVRVYLTITAFKEKDLIFGDEMFRIADGQLDLVFAAHRILDRIAQSIYLFARFTSTNHDLVDLCFFDTDLHTSPSLAVYCFYYNIFGRACK